MNSIKFLVAFACLLSVASAGPILDLLDKIPGINSTEIMNVVHDIIPEEHFEHFEKFLEKFPRVFKDTDEVIRRARNFLKHILSVEKSMKAFEAGESSFKSCENKFMDWDDEELMKLRGSKPMLNQNVTAGDHQKPVGEDPPASKDWTTESSCAGQVQSQGSCGSCYAVSALSMLSSMHCLKMGTNYELSSQQILDCSPESAVDGITCKAGYVGSVLDYLSKTGKVALQECYPYQGEQQECKFDSMSTECTVKSSPFEGELKSVRLNSEEDMKFYVGTNGPVVTYIYASDNFDFYDIGIFTDSMCNNTADQINHAVVIYGYGTEDNQDYWLIKNSWGDDWGQAGFMKIKRGENTCSVGIEGYTVVA